MRSRARLLMRIWAATAFSLGVAEVAPARTIYVDANGTGDYPTIQAAIDAATDGDIIILQPGTYTGPGNRDITFKGKAITVRSIEPNDTNIVAGTVIDCNGTEVQPHRGFYFYGRAARQDSFVSGLTITNGYVVHGGGICCDEYSSPTISHCRIIGNQAMRGGGIYVDDGTPTVTACVIEDNSVASESYRGEGGGIYCGIVSGLTVTDCLIIRNSATGSGANQGAGGGIHLSNCRATVRHCTVAANSAQIGGGIYCNEYADITIADCIVWANSAADSPQLSGTPVVAFSNVQGGFTGTGNIDTDPLFVDAGVMQYQLSAHSPCIDFGDPEFVPFIGETDIDGEPRVMGTRVDMGADEFRSTPTAVISVMPKAISLHGDQGGPNPENQVVTIRNAGSGSLVWNVIEDCSWLEIDPHWGESLGESDSVNLSVDTSGLDSGEYNCKLTIAANGAPNSPQTVFVTVFIRATSGQLHVPFTYQTIQSAIHSAQDGDTVILAERTYTGQGNYDLDLKGKAITIRSTNPEDPVVVASTIIDCQQQSRAFNFHCGEGATSVVRGLTIKNGSSKGGCGICVQGSSPTIIQCSIVGNSSTNDNSSGGGISVRDGSPTISRCVVSKNTVKGSGGGIFCYNSNPTIMDCTIVGNQACDEGGAISCQHDSNPVIKSCLIKDNVVTFRRGGGIACRNSSLEITNCTLANNSAYYDGGGGLWLVCSDAVISQCTIMGNSTRGSWGGGIYFELGKATIRNCVISSNSAPNGQEIGIYSWQGYYDGPPNPEPYPNSFLTISHTNLAGGQPKVYIFGDPGWFLLNWGPGNIDLEPCFADPDNGEYHLKSQAGRWNPEIQGWVKDDVTSPCIDAGDPMSPIGHEPFPNGGRINMGAYGGTVEASKAYFGEPICETIVAGDINGDCRVDLADFEIMALHWLEDHRP